MATGTGYPPSRQGQCAHVYGHCATLFSNPSCNYYWAGDCQARRAKDVPITMASRTQSPLLTPRFLQRGCHFVQITLAVEIWISLFSFHFLGAAGVWSQNHLPSPQLHPWVLSLYLETIMMKRGRNAISCRNEFTSGPLCRILHLFCQNNDTRKLRMSFPN